MQDHHDIESPTTPTTGRNKTMVLKPADAVEQAPPSPNSSNKNRTRWMIGICVLLVAVAVAGGVVAVVMVVGGGGGDDDDDDNAENRNNSNNDEGDKDMGEDPSPTNANSDILYEIRYASRTAPEDDEPSSHQGWTYEWWEPHVTTVGGEPAIDEYSLTYFPNGTDASQEFFFEYDGEFDPQGDLVERWSMELMSVRDGEAVIKATLVNTARPGLDFFGQCSQEWTMTIPLDENQAFEPAEPMLDETPLLCEEPEPMGTWSYQPGVASFQVYVPPPQYEVDIYQFYAWSSAWTGHRHGPEILTGSSDTLDLGVTWVGDKYEFHVTDVDDAGEATIEVTSLRGNCKNRNSFVLTAIVDSGEYGTLSDSEKCYDSNDTMYVEQMKARIWSVKRE